jgi:hypothetical protein
LLGAGECRNGGGHEQASELAKWMRGYARRRPLSRDHI